MILQARTTAAQNTLPAIGTAASVKAPVWLRLEYLNGVTNAYYMHDGGTWTRIGTNSVHMSLSTYQYGLAAASRSSYPNTSVYSDLQNF